MEKTSVSLVECKTAEVKSKVDEATAKLESTVNGFHVLSVCAAPMPTIEQFTGMGAKLRYEKCLVTITYKYEDGKKTK